MTVLTRRSLATALFVVAFVASACSGSPSPAPTAAPTPTPTPAPTPFDVSAAFLEIVTDPDFAARIDVDGDIQMGVTAVMSGTIEGAGRDSHQTTTVKFGSVTQTTESIRVGGKAWTRTLPGPWLVASASSGNGLSDWLEGLETLEDAGVVTKNGMSLHHLIPDGGASVPPDVLGLDPAQFSDPEISIELYAKDDGTPALFVLGGSWVQTVNGQELTVNLDIDMTVSDVGETITVKAPDPDDVWKTYTSGLGYSVAHPSDFTVVRQADGDTYRRDGEDWFYVVPYAEGKGRTAEGFADLILAGYAEDPGPPRDEPVKTTAGGGVAYRMTFDLETNDGTAIVLVDLVTVHANLGWEISLVTIPSNEQEDTKLFETFMASFRFTK